MMVIEQGSVCFSELELRILARELQFYFKSEFNKFTRKHWLAYKQAGGPRPARGVMHSSLPIMLVMFTAEFFDSTFF